jgi:uncharacterized secreted protein with C-terminal beta-propeller domain
VRKHWTILALAALLFAACGREQGPRSSPSSRDTAAGPVVHAASTRVSLERFDACPSLLGHLRAEALKRIGPYGLPGGFGGPVAFALDTVAPGAAAERSSEAAQSGQPAFSGTNVQETNVDEPDSVKTDGRHIFTLKTDPANGSRQSLVAVAVAGGKPALAGSIVLPEAYGYELLLAGDRLLAIGQKGGYAIADGIRGGPAGREVAPGFAPQEPGTVVAIVDVSDREHLRITNTLDLDGTYASARMVGGIARLVLNSQSSKIAFEQPVTYTVEAQKKALEANKAKIKNAGVDAWLPHFKLQDDSGKVTSEGTLSSCKSTFHPKTFSGFGEMSVVTIDPANPDPRESASVIGSAGTVYASTSNLYVATQDWPQPQPLILSDRPVSEPAPIQAPAKTSLHRFDIRDPLRAVYAASGEVRGTVLNQWSMSEHDGFLRVATTEDRFSQSPDGAPSTSSFVTVLDAKTAKLTSVGSVNDISPGERIYGVRFIDTIGYVVTFKQIDPLHVIDLSTPSDPRVLGELEIPGYSAYLHPVGDGLLLGVGRDADTEGRPLGTSISLFDVSDAAHPKRLDVERIADSYTQVENDHHAFTWWEPSKLALLPVELQNVQVVSEPSQTSPDGSTSSGSTGSGSSGSAVPPEKVEPTSYVYGFRVEDGSITKVGRLTHQQHTQQYLGQIARSIVIDDTLFTISTTGIAASNLDSFAEKGWVSLS